jgi:heparanase 1
LGNEDQSQVDEHPDIYAQDFGTLNTLVTKYWPDPAIRPKLYGPDDQLGPNWGLQQFLQEVIKQKIPMVGITSHEYYGMNNDAYIDPSRLDSNFHTSYNWTATLDQYFGTDRQIQMWAGEIGPSIGGSGDCTENYYRFNGFADGFWYLDSLGAHAQAGYQAFARQDFYGIDYALLDCTSITPVPDYYSAIVWNIVMGSKVLNTTRPGKGLVRPYAHCSKQYPGSVAVLIVNIWSGSSDVKVSLTSGSLGTTRDDWLFTTSTPATNPYPQGMYGKGIQLNGVNLTYTVGGQLPTLKPVPGKGTDLSMITMPAYSYGFFVYPGSSISACK